MATALIEIVETAKNLSRHIDSGKSLLRKSLENFKAFDDPQDRPFGELTKVLAKSLLDQSKQLKKFLECCRLIIDDHVAPAPIVECMKELEEANATDIRALSKLVEIFGEVHPTFVDNTSTEKH